MTLRSESAVNLTPAEEGDISAIVSLMNRAYRGAGEDASWTTERDFITGDRTGEAYIREALGGMLVWRDEAGGPLLGCVKLDLLDDGVWFLGSLAVDPRRQATGQGRRLLTAAEHWVKARGGATVRMTVIHVRDLLLAWYERRGYVRTGETEAFPYGDNRFGIAQRDDLYFVVLEKSLAG